MLSRDGRGLYRHYSLVVSVDFTIFQYRNRQDSKKKRQYGALMPDKTSRTLRTIFLAPIVLIPCVFLGWLLYCSWHVQDRYREGERFTAGMRRVETDFRKYFHGKSDYPAYTLDELKASGILSRDASDFIAAHSGKYVPFSPKTPEDSVVLSIKENLFSSWDLTKDELTREPRPEGGATDGKP